MGVKNIDKEGSGEERLLEAQHRNKQLSIANKDLTDRNEILRKERDFYLKEATVYKEIVEKLETQKIQTVENRAYANESSGTQSIGGGESVVSTSSYEAVSKSQNIEQIGKEEEGIIDYTENNDTDKKIENEDNYIRNLENQLQLVNTILQTLQKKTSLTDFSPLDSLSIIINEQQEFQKEHKLLQEKCTAMAGVYVENLKLQEENKRLREGIDPDLEGKISILQAQLDRLRGGANPEENEQRVREIATLQAQLDRLRDGATPEENEQRIREISTLQAEVTRLSQRADPAEYAARVREIQERDVNISTLQAEVERLRNGEELAEYGRQVQRLEMEIAKLLGVAVESQTGQTNVWLPLDSDTFIHTEDLKPVLIVSDQALKDSIASLRAEYDRIASSLSGRPKMNTNSLRELDHRDVTTFSVVYKNLSNIRAVRAVEVDECKRLLQETVVLYESFQNEKSHEISGLKEYIDVQNIYSRISGEISFPAFTSLMRAFDQAKDQFVRELKQRIGSLASAQVLSCSKLLDWVELEYRDFTRTEFIKRFTSVPGRDDPRYNDSGFVLLNQHLGMGSTFDNLGLKTRTNRRTGEITPGLDAQDPFANFLIEIDRNPEAYAKINSVLVETVEKMYMMKYMNERWNDLKSGLDEDLKMKINRFNVRTADSKSLLNPTVKKILVSMIQEKEDFLKKGALVHAANRKDLDELLKPALSYGNLPLWRANGAVDLREQLIDIYTTYGGLVRTGFAIHARSTKIKEFHEE